MRSANQAYWELGLYRTSHLVWKSGKFSKSELSGNLTFYFPDAGLLTLFFFKIFFVVIYFWHQICVQGPYLMRIDNLYLVGKMFKNISPDSVRSGRTCPANLGVRSCPVRKVICPVRLSPNNDNWSNKPCLFYSDALGREAFFFHNYHQKKKKIKCENMLFKYNKLSNQINFHFELFLVFQFLQNLQCGNQRCGWCCFTEMIWKQLCFKLSSSKIASTQQRKWIDSSAVCIHHYFSNLLST